MQETIEKRKEKLKHKIAMKPLFKPKPEESVKESGKILVGVKTEKAGGQQKVKAGFVPPPIARHEVKSRKTNLPLFGLKQATELSASEEKMKSTATEIKVKREVKEHLKGSIEELVSEPQKLKAISSEIEEIKEIMVRMDFEITLPSLKSTIYPPTKPPEIKPLQFIPSTPRIDFDIDIPETKPLPPMPFIVPKLSVEELPETIMRNYFDKEVSQQVISKIKEVAGVKIEVPGAGPEVSFEDFEEIKKDEEIWITESKTGLPSDAQLFLIIGRKGAGLEVLRGLLQLELFDRGRQPNPHILLPPEKTGKSSVDELEKIEEIAYDNYKFYRLIWAENYPFEFLKDKPMLRNRIYEALRKGILKYVVFTNEEVDRVIRGEEIKLAEEVKKEFEGIFDEFGNLSIVNLNKIPFSEDQLKKLGQIFAKILQVAKSKFKIDRVIQDILERKRGVEESIDSLWQSVWKKKNSALEVLRNNYENNKDIMSILPPRAKLQNESDEHFVIKLLIVKYLLKRGKKNWKILPETPENEESGEKWKIETVQEDLSEEIAIEKDIKDKERKTIKRPDLIVKTNGGKSIWIEMETCKNIKDPLKFVKDKLRKLKEIEDYEPPNELWLVFPYRKYFLYGFEQFKEMFIDDFNDFRTQNQTEKLKPRIFFADLYDEKLVELERGKD